jgi:hypothetical protein
LKGFIPPNATNRASLFASPEFCAGAATNLLKRLIDLLMPRD